MTVQKIITTDPSSAVTKVDANSVSTLLNRGCGNEFILDSIADFIGTIIPLGDFANLSPAELAGQLKAGLMDTLNKLKESGAFDIGDLTGINFDDIRQKCVDFLGEDLLGGIKAGLESLGNLGDLIGLGEISDFMKSLGFDPDSFFSDFDSDFFKNLLSNFDLDKLMPGLSDFLTDEYLNRFTINLKMLNPDWYWLDKDAGLYNYDILSRLSPWSLRALEYDSDYIEVVGLARALRGHRIETTE